MPYSSKYRTSYQSWRGGNFTARTIMKLKAIPTYVRVTQGGLSFAPASAMTHAGLGAFDLNTDGMTKAQVWQLAKELLQVRIIALPRGFNYDSFQGRTIGNTNDGNEHLHCLDLDEKEHMHWEARAQCDEVLRGGDGLVGSARYYGPSLSNLRTWGDSPHNPANKKPKPAAVVKKTVKKAAAKVATLAGITKTGTPSRYRRGTFHTIRASVPRVRPDDQAPAARTAVAVGESVQVGEWIGQADGHGWVKDMLSDRYWNFDDLAVGAAVKPATFKTGDYTTTAKTSGHQYPTSAGKKLTTVDAGTKVKVVGWAGNADTHPWARDDKGRYWNLEQLRRVESPGKA